MKECPKCKVGHDKSGIFCSRICANSRIFSDESKKKKSIALLGRKHVLSPESEAKRLQNLKVTWDKKYEATPYEELGMVNRRRRILEEQNETCNRCGLSEWMGHKLSLELEHKDGNSENNVRENLECLCPNCHSLTDTWRGRNKPVKNGINKVSDEQLLQYLNSTNSIRQGLLLAGMACKGNNYTRAKKLLNPPL